METFIVGSMVVHRFSPSHGLTDRRILFSHANGIAALTYRDVLQRWADKLNVEIFAYDARGHGTNNLDTRVAYQHGISKILSHLKGDLKTLLGHLQKQFPGSWSLAGHSLGGWLSLYSAAEMDIDHVILIDMPLLAPASAFLWATACLFRQRGVHPLSRPARRRKRFFRSRRQALLTFKRSAFFRKWSEHHVEHYIDANFQTLEDGTLKLRHDPEWEADLFESQPALHTPLFLKISPKIRQSMRIEMIAGSESKICAPKAIRYFCHFFPRTRWLVVPQGGHMFPFENTTGMLKALELVFPNIQSSSLGDVERQAV